MGLQQFITLPIMLFLMMYIMKLFIMVNMVEVREAMAMMRSLIHFILNMGFMMIITTLISVRQGMVINMEILLENIKWLCQMAEFSMSSTLLMVTMEEL